MGWILASAAVIAALALLSGLKRAVVLPGEAGLLYRDGSFVRELGPGAHRWFDLLGRTRVHRVSLLPRPLATATDARAVHEGTRSAATAPAAMAA